jgi:hypothetical protein
MVLKPDVTFEQIKAILDSDLGKKNKEFYALKEGEESFSLIRDLIINLKNG